MFIEKIRERLKAKFPGVNLSKTRLDEITARLSNSVTAEDQIDGILDQANGIFPFEQIAREDDRARSLEAAAKKQQDPAPGGTPPGGDPKDDTPAWAKTLLETVKAQNDKIELLEKGKTKETLSQKAAEALKAKNIPEAFAKVPLKNFSIEKEEDLEAWVSEIQESFTEFEKTSNQKRFEDALNPLEGNASPETVKKDIQNWAAAKSPQS
jgi:hypothetical protein